MTTATETSETTQEAQGAPKIEVKVTPTKPFSGPKEKAKSDEAAILDALGARAKDSWSVNRLSAKGHPRATLGVLEVTVTADDIKGGRLHSKLGAGTYELVNMADPKEKYVLPLGTQTPPQEFGTPAEDDEEEVVFSMPDGRPVVGRVKKAVGPQPYYPPGASWGQAPWQGAHQPQTDPALKATLDAVVKMLEKMSEKKDDGPDAKTLIELKKMEVEAAKEESKSKAVVAKAEADARVQEARIAADLRIAEFKAKSEADRDAAKTTATIQADASKAIAEAQARQATAFASAQEKAAAMQLEAAKASAAALVESAKAKATGESGMFERLLKQQEDMKPERPPTLMEQMGEIEQLKKMFAPPSAEGIVQYINAGKDAAVSIIGNLIALRNATVQYVLVGPDGKPLQAAPQQAAVQNLGPAAPPANGALPPAAAAALLTGTAANPPAPGAVPADAGEAAKVDDAKALARQVLDGLKTLEEGAKRQVQPETIAAALRKSLPKVYEWLRATSPENIIGEIGAMIDTPAFSDGEKKAALACRTTLAGDLVWLLNVLTAVRA